MIANQKLSESSMDHIMGTAPSNNTSHPNQKDTTLTKIFVGGLPYHTNDDSLRSFFEVYGSIEEAVVITDRQTGKSRGYGFVTMTNVEDAYRAISNPNPCIDGRKANVNLAILGAKPRILPGVNSGPMAISRMIPIQSLVPQVSTMYNNMLNSSLLTPNLINLQMQSLSNPFNFSALRNSAPYPNSIYNLPASNTMSTGLHNAYPFMPYPITSDGSILQSNHTTHNQAYLPNNQQYISALNVQQQLVNQAASSNGLLKGSKEISNYSMDPSYLLG